MINSGIPVWNRSAQVFGVDVGEWPKIQVPLVGIVGLELKVSVLVLVGLLHDGVFEIVALTKRSVAVIVVVHPLIHGRSLLAHGFESGMGMEQRQRGGQAVVGNAVHADLAVVVGNILDEPFDRIVGISCFVCCLGIVQVDPGGKIEDSL